MNQTVKVHICALAYLVGIQRRAQLYPCFRRVCKSKTSISRRSANNRDRSIGHLSSKRLPTVYLIRLHCISRIQPSSIGSVPMIGFSARHDKCLPASALVAMKDRILVVVFSSLEVCNKITTTSPPVFPAIFLLSLSILQTRYKNTDSRVSRG